MPNEVIKTIAVYEDNVLSGEVDIGTSANLVDYDNGTVEEALNDIKNQLITLNAAIAANTAKIEEMNEKFTTAKTIINKMDNVQDRLDQIPNEIQTQVQDAIDRKTFLTENIIYQQGMYYKTLKEILGNLMNLPLNSTNLREWMEKISNILSNQTQNEEAPQLIETGTTLSA